MFSGEKVRCITYKANATLAHLLSFLRIQCYQVVIRQSCPVDKLQIGEGMYNVNVNRDSRF